MKKIKNICIFIFILLIITIINIKISNVLFKNNNINKVNEELRSKENNDFDENVIPVINIIQPKNEVKLTLVGDLLFEQPFYDAIDKKNYDKNTYFELVSEYFLNDDLSIGNMEVVIGNDNLKSSGTGYNFCAPEYIGDLVSSLDFEVLSTANNHSYDRKLDGIISTIDYFKNNTDILTVGTYKSKEDREKGSIIEINGIKFGFVSYTLGTNIIVPKKYRDLVGLYRDPDTSTVTQEYKNILINEINALKDESDVIIALIHWGKEFTNTPNKEQKDLAKLLNENGVDIIVGSHSHSIEPIEWIGDEHKTLVYYSLGNFVSADDDISRTYEKFDNAYQFGLLSQLIVTKEDNNITIDNITSQAIINYYDKDMNNFKLIPLDKYTEDYEKTHFRYKYNFNKKFVEDMYKNVIHENFR